MPKLKTNRGTVKRFKVIANGQFKHRRSNKNHILTKKAANRKRNLRGLTLVDGSDLNRIVRLLNRICRKR